MRPQPPPALGVDELEALVDATRAIAEVLDLDPVLQLIVDRVRTLVGAEYAALGLPDASGRMERFITSGIGPRCGPPSATHRADTACSG